MRPISLRQSPCILYRHHRSGVGEVPYLTNSSILALDQVPEHLMGTGFLENQYKLDGAVAVVTGGSSGIWRSPRM